MWTVRSPLARILIAVVGATFTFGFVVVAVMMAVVAITGIERFDHNAGAGFALFVLAVIVALPASLIAFGLLLAFVPSVPTGQKPHTGEPDA